MKKMFLFSENLQLQFEDWDVVLLRHFHVIEKVEELSAPLAHVRISAASLSLLWLCLMLHGSAC